LDQGEKTLFSRAIRGGGDAFVDKQWLLDPSPWYAYMRQNCPVLYDPISQNIHLFRYNDCDHVLTQFRAFSNNFVQGDEGVGPDDIGAMRSLLGRDPPFHTKLRKIVSASFNPNTIAAMEPRIASTASELLEAARSRGKLSFISGFAVPFPSVVMAEMLGVPASDWNSFKVWSDNETNQTEESDFDVRRNLHARFVEYLERIIDERTRHPGNDLISLIASSEVDGNRLAVPDVTSFCILLLVGGIETTTTLIDSAVRLFIKHDSFPRLRENPSLIPCAIEEVLRFSSPVRTMGRTAVEDTAVSGWRVKKGQRVVAWLGSANRDESKFPGNEDFDIRRNPNPHIAFGHGIHMCIGAPLARLEAKIAIAALIDKFPEIRLAVAEGDLDPVKNFNVCGVKELPLILSN
jgi:cytochrome P450